MQVTIPDEAAELVQRLSASQGYRSVDEYVNSLILDDSQRIDARLAQADDADLFEPLPVPESTDSVPARHGR